MVKVYFAKESAAEYKRLNCVVLSLIFLTLLILIGFTCQIPEYDLDWIFLSDGRLAWSVPWVQSSVWGGAALLVHYSFVKENHPTEQDGQEQHPNHFTGRKQQNMD